MNPLLNANTSNTSPINKTFTLHHAFSVGSGAGERFGQEAALVMSLIMGLGAALL